MALPNELSPQPDSSALSAAMTPLWEETSLFSLDSLYPLHGNKAYTLAPNIRFARELGLHEIVTIGGAWSNHLWSTAHLASSVGLSGVVYVRGEPAHGLTPTLSDVVRCGFDIEFLSREKYQRRDEDSFLNSLKARHPKALWIPEGGSNEAGVAGAALIADHILAACPQVQRVVMAVGTGGTFAGLVAVSKNKHPFLTFRKVSSSLGVAVIPSLPGFLHKLNELGSEIRRFISRIQTLVDRNRHRCVDDGLEFRIASFVGQPGP